MSQIINLSSGDAFEALQNDAVLVDIRKSYETGYKKFDVKNLIFLPKNKLHEDYKNLDKDKFYILADSTGISSKKAALFLTENGFAKVANLSGGIMDWERNGKPVRINKKDALATPYFYNSKPKNFIKTTLVKDGKN